MRFVAWFCISICLLACSVEKKAQRAFRLGEYQKVITMYQGVVAREPDNGKAHFYLGESYRRSNRIKEAEQYYAKANGSDINIDSAKLYLAKAMQANGRYDEAEEVLQSLADNVTERRLKKRIDQELTSLGRFRELQHKTSYYTVKNMQSINTPFAEYSPVHSNGMLYFTSSRSNSRIYEATGTPYTDIYKVNTQGAVIDPATLKLLSGGVNQDNINEGCMTFTPDGNTMVFAKGNSGKGNGTSDVDLYISYFRRGAWTAPRPININLPNAWESTPAFGADGRTLYFSSNRRGGYGGLDLYAATLGSRGRFVNVRNLGPSINTIGNELFPYQARNKKLYFSSDSHPGYGMLDIFVVNRVKGKYVAENLGKPMNSVDDDFGIFMFKADRGFFTSNRPEGLGDDDIYTFINEDPDLKVVNYTLEGIAYTPRSDSSLQVMSNVVVSLYDADDNLMNEFSTTADGKFSFRVFEDEDYTLMGETDGYLVKRQPFTTVGKSIPKESLKELLTEVTLDTIMVLDRLSLNKIFVLQNIYFGYDSADVKREAAKELDKLVALLNDNPTIKIEMGSHTDSVASHSYNLELSNRRAEATVEYIISKGIASERLVAKGYGETKPIASNTNPDGSDNPEGRAKNRRTEFKILEIGPAKPSRKPEGTSEEDKYFKDNNND